MLFKIEIKIELSVFWFFFGLKGQKKVTDIIRSECGFAKDAHDLKDRSADFKFMLNDGNEAVGNDCNMYLNTYCIFGFTPKSFDLKMLFNPFKEQLDLPPIFIEESNVFRFEIKVIRVIDKTSMQFWNIIDNSSNNSWVFFFVLLLRKADTLVFEHVISSLKNAFTIDNFISGFTFFSNNEECSGLVNSVESRKVKVSSVKYIACQRLIRKPVHGVNVMNFGIGDSIEHRNLCSDVNLGMDSDSRFCASEFCPSEHRHTEINGCGINCIELSMQLKIFCESLGLCNGYHVKSKLLKDSMVSEFICLRQHLSVDWLRAKTKVLRFLSMGSCYICEFPEAPATYELAKHQNQQMVPVRHRPTIGPVVEFGGYASELSLRKKLYNLCKNEYPCMHIYSEFESDAKVSISKPGHGFGWVKRCA